MANKENEVIEPTSEWGIDYALLQSNLSLSPEERLRRHQEALDLVLEMTYAGWKLGYGAESRFLP